MTRQAVCSWMLWLSLLPLGRVAAEPPALAVLITVDQLGRDRADPSLPGGLGQLAREGRVFSRGELAHAIAETCPGHAAIATGRHPGRSGLSSNQFVARDSGRIEYCVEDDPEAAAVLGGSPGLGRSPPPMRLDTIGDWLRASHGGAKVVAVAGKDRAAIALGGPHPDGAYWLRRPGEVAFTTSRYYAPELPGWVRAWNRAHSGFAGVPERWEHAPAARAGVDPRRPDDYPYEQANGLGRVSGHPLRGATVEESSSRLYRSPFIDRLTLDFAATAVEALGLGDDDVPDLLAVSLSGTDTVGHSFGPESHEARDALLRLDRWLGEWLEALEQRVGEGGLVVVLTSDHGVLPLPEWLAETGRGACPVAAGRLPLDELRGSLGWHLHWELGRWYEWPRPWLWHSGLQLTVNRSLAASRGVEPRRVLRAAEEWLEARPEVAAAWTAEELAASGEPMAVRYRRSVDPEQGADLVVQPAEGCLISGSPLGTSHGTPYAYDRDVPIVFVAPGLAPGTDPRPATTVDVAPTLAELLGISTPDDLDGRSLLP